MLHLLQPHQVLEPPPVLPQHVVLIKDLPVQRVRREVATVRGAVVESPTWGGPRLAAKAVDGLLETVPLEREFLDAIYVDGELGVEAG
jgi:hypothetical protein